MLTAHNFSYGLVTPVLAYLMSCLGAFLGLRCTARAMATTGRERLRWLLLGALSIGTTGIWVMHFIAMLGYTVPGQIIHYNVLVTIASMLIAVVVTGIGLLIVGFGRQNWATLVLAGTFMGLGVATMHYTGMAAVRLTGRMTFSPTLFILSVIIAVVACTVALWFHQPDRAARDTRRRPHRRRRRQRHALHRHGCAAHVACWRGRRHEHGGRRRHRGRLPAAPADRDQHPGLHHDGDHRTVAE